MIHRTRWRTLGDFVLFRKNNNNTSFVCKYFSDESRITLLKLCLEGVNLDNSFDYRYVANKLRGYTGSDIANLCRDAAMMGMRRKIVGQTPDQIKNIKRADIDLPVTVQDFNEAIERCRKTVTGQDIEKYQSWIDEFGSF